MRRWLVLLFIFCGCTTAPPPATRPYTEEELRAQVQADNRDPWPHYGLAKLYMQRRNYEDAVREYGRTVNLLPPNKATRPVLELGILHHRMGNPEPALRCYDEVLKTIPASNNDLYEQNNDFKYAAVGAKVILESQGGDHAARIEELRYRFLRELGGTEEAWDRGAIWIKPLEEPGPEKPGPEKPAPE